MTDERRDRLVRDTDPYRPDPIERLAGAGQTLLEEIMSTPELDSVATTLMPDQAPQNDTWTGVVGLPSSGAGGAGGGGCKPDREAAEGHPVC